MALSQDPSQDPRSVETQTGMEIEIAKLKTMNRITVNGDIKTDWFRPQPMGFFLFELLPGRYPALGQALDHT